jgi:uncharacterized protein
MIEGCKFRGHLQAVLLEGIALAGFNVVDINGLSRRVGLPVLVVVKHEPDVATVRETLLNRVPGGAAKWALIAKAGALEETAGLWVQRAGLTLPEADALIRATAIHGRLPEPLRIAHMIAGGTVAPPVTPEEDTG